MAEETGDGTGGLYKGAIFPVTVEECLKDMVVVCLKHGSNIYRGVLMDSTQSKMPYGLGFDLLKLQCVQKNSTGMTASLDPVNQDKGTKISALSLRHTYQQDENSTDMKLLPPAHIGINRPLGGKNVRSMRLRPRQVLCSKCKSRVQDNPSAVNSSSSSSTSSNAPKITPSPVKLTLPILPPSLNPEVSLTKLDLRKRRFIGDLCDHFSAKKSKTDSGSSLAKTSPVIKISFASPRGRGTVVKIPAKIKHENGSETEELPQKSQQDEQEKKEEYKKLKKALKKAKLKEKTSVSGEQGQDVLGYKHHHKKSKRNKHKAKKKRRHKDSERPADEKDQPTENHSDFENDRVTDLVYTEVKEPEEKEEWSTVNEYLDSGDKHNANDLSLKENSQNVPLKGKISRTFTSLPIRDDRPSFESSRMSTSSGNSDHSSEYDMNSDCESEENEEAPGEHVEGTVSIKVEEDDDGSEMRGKIEPLMMRIKTKTVTKCMTPEGRAVCIGDVVWGKIHGFPWWPGQVTSISISQRDGVVLSQTASVSWFGSSTMSIMPCSEIHPFLQDFELRYNKKKKGPYKTAIRQACSAARNVAESPADKPLIPVLED